MFKREDLDQPNNVRFFVLAGSTVSENLFLPDAAVDNQAMVAVGNELAFNPDGDGEPDD